MIQSSPNQQKSRSRFNKDLHKVDTKCTLKRYRVRNRQLNSLISKLLDHLGLGPCELSLEFIGPQKMRTVNRTFRNKDKSTDVLSFPQNNWKTPALFQQSSGSAKERRKVLESFDFSDHLHLGDLLISLDDAMHNAKNIGQGLDREVSFLIVHGLLHLCGHDHMNPKEERLMLKEQNKAMKSIIKTADWHKLVTQKSPPETSRKSLGPKRSRFKSGL